MVIQTRRLLLQSPQEVTAEDVLAYYVSIADFRKEFNPDRDPSFYTESDQRQLLRNQTEAWEGGRAYRFYIRLREGSGPIIGTVALNNVVRGAFQSCFLGYSLDAEHGNQGYMTEAVNAVTAFAFEELGLHRIEGNVMPGNAPSRAVLEKCGFAMEGLSRGYLKINGVWEDHLHYVLLKEEMEKAGANVGIEHIAMYVTDLEAARDFFRTYLGAKANEGYHNPKTGFRSYFLTFDDGARLELMNKPHMEDGEKSPNRTGYAHIAFRLGSREAVDALTRRLQQDGYALLSGSRTTGDGYYESCLLAIEGNPIELTV